MELPQGLTRTDFSNAIQQIERVVGKQWVFTSDEDVTLYRDAYSPYWGEKQELLPSAAAAPESVDQILSIVEIANRYKLPLYPISTGMNLTYGGSAPTYPGSVILELKRMNRILAVSERDANCLVEPGVSYFDLYRYLRDNKIRLWIDTPDPGWGSLLGNALDHGVGQTRGDFRDHFSAHCGMEVILGNGDLVRTGMGAAPKAETWQQFKYGLGPWLDGIFSQANYGIVTKMGFALMPEPEAALQVTIESPKRDDIHAHLDILSSLMYKHIVDSRGGIFSPVLMGPLTPELVALRSRPGDVPTTTWDRYAQSVGRNFWRSNFTLYGPPKVIDAQWEYIREAFSKIPGVICSEVARLKFPLTDQQVDAVVDKAMLGIPSLKLFATRTDGTSAPRQSHIDFSPVVPRNGASFLKACDLIGEVIGKYGFEFLGASAAARDMGRGMVMLHEILFTKDAEKNRKARALFTELVDMCGEQGWPEYRVHPYWHKQAMGYYNFNDHALHRLHETIKDALDPNGIIAPGRYNIWPKHLRSATQ